MSRAEPTPPPDCYEGDPALLPAAQATARIMARAAPVAGRETIALAASLGRVLAREVRSPIDVPGHTNSAMDGYAVRGSDVPGDGERRLRVLGTAWAGKPFREAVPEGHAVEIMTGAIMPPGTDTVIMQEHVTRAGDEVAIGTGHRTGQHVRERGEDVRAGAVVLAAGRRVSPAELGLVASLGVAEVEVHRRVRVATFTTGDELRSLGEPLEPGAIYDSNRYTLRGMLTRLGAEIDDLGVVRDRPDAVREAMRAAAASADVVIASGGASTGEADYVEQTLRALGEPVFWRVAIRPGRPLAFGRVGDALFFGLPGNPVAVMVTFYQFVQPALRRIAGESGPCVEPMVRATCRSRLRKKAGRVEYYRAVLGTGADGRLEVEHTGKTGSGLLHTMSDANCFIVLPEDAGPVEPGAEVSVQPFFGLV